jgi:uncharacterized protein (DUF433 family)
MQLDLVPRGGFQLRILQRLAVQTEEQARAIETARSPLRRECVVGGDRLALSSCVRGMAMTTERIEINSAVMMGKPVIRGTRITVELILRKLAEGATEAALLEDYPHLKADDIRAAIAYGAASVAHEEVVLLSDALAVTKS